MRLARALENFSAISAAMASGQLPSIGRGDGCCDVDGHDGAIDNPIGVSVAAALRMLCDADAQLVVTDDDGNVQRVSRRVGLVRGARRREVEARDGHRCSVPGCTRRGRLDVHHIVHRVHGGGNELSNLLVLCRFHHHRLHEGGWKAVAGSDGFEFHAADGRRIANRPREVHGSSTAVSAHQRSAKDGRCRWIGDRLDLDMALTALFSRTNPTPWGVDRVVQPL